MATLTYLTTTHFDFGALQKLPAELDKVGISKPFIATDAGVRAAGLVDKVTGALAADVPISIFDETPGNPTEAAVTKTFEQYSADGCNGVLAIGGGGSFSPLSFRRAAARPFRLSRATFDLRSWSSYSLLPGALSQL